MEEIRRGKPTVMNRTDNHVRMFYSEDKMRRGRDVCQC